MNTDDQKYKDFVSTIPKDLLNSTETQDMSLSLYFNSIFNVLNKAMSISEISDLLHKVKNNGGSMQLLRDEVDDFDVKVYEEFSKLVKERME